MSSNPTTQQQATGNHNLGGTQELLSRTPTRRARRIVERARQGLDDREETSIAIKVLSEKPELQGFESCNAVFSLKLMVRAIVKRSTVEDLGLAPIEFKNPHQIVWTPWGCFTATHFVNLVVEKELYGLVKIALENVLVVDDNLPHPRGDIFFGKPFMRDHCDDALPAKVPRHASVLSVPQHATQHDPSGTGRKNTGKRPVRSKRERSPQQTIWESHEQENVGNRPPPSKKPRISAFQMPTQTQNSGRYNPNSGVIGQPTSTSLSVPLGSQYHPLLEAQTQYARNTPVPTSYGDGSIPTATPYCPPRQAPRRLEPTYTPAQPQSHQGTYIPQAGGVQPDGPGHFRDQYVQENSQAVYSDLATQNTAEVAAPPLEDPTEQSGISDTYNCFYWYPSEFGPAGGSHSQF